VAGPERRLSCARCGAPCCPACAFSLEALAHCRPCGEALLEADGAPLDLRWPEPGGGAEARAGEVRAPAGPGRRWLIVVARSQAELYAHLRQAFALDDKVEVLLDRRGDLSRNPPAVVDRLRTHGAALVRRAPRRR
jgi:hypothetical protein